MSIADFFGGVRDRIDPIARDLSLITISRDADGRPRFKPHIPFTDGGERDPRTGNITDGRTAHEVLYPIASSLSLVTPKTNPDTGERYFALHIPFTPGGTYNPRTQTITDGQTAGETATKAADGVGDAIKEGLADLGQGLGQGLGNLGEGLGEGLGNAIEEAVKPLVPIALLALAAHIITKKETSA